MEKIILFFIISLLLGFIITYFYNKKINKDFFLIFIIISSILFIIFYYLAQTNEYYTNYLNEMNNSTNTSNKTNFYNDSIINTNYIIRDNLDSEVNDYIVDNIESKKNNNIEKEEELYPEIKTQEETDFIKDNINQLTDYVSNNLLRPDFANYFMKTPIPSQSPIPSTTPINININYGGNDRNDRNDNNNKEDNKPKNLGNANCSRIYNNSDWIYGDNAWTTKPDYYVPDCSESKYTNCNNCDSCKDCCQCNKKNTNSSNNSKNSNNKKPLNESMPTKKCKNDVAPIMVNVPWTNYQSGDIDPEPYNL